MKKRAVYLVLLMFAFTASIALAEPWQWSAESGGNDHYYEVVINRNVQGEPVSITWDEAKAAADARSGNWHLVSINSAAENDFVFSLFEDDPDSWAVSNGLYYGPWIGAYRYSTFDSKYFQFLWGNGEQFLYANWGPRQPNGNGDYVHFLGRHQGQSTWNDLDLRSFTLPVAYVVETASQNQPPVLDPIGNKTVYEGDTISLSISAGDADGDNLTYAVANLPQGADFDPDTRQFEWVTDYGDAGHYEVTFTVSDDGDPVPLSDSETVVVTVGNLNRPPVLAAIDDWEVDEGDPLAFTISATDPDGNNLAYRAENLPVGALFDVDTQTFSWTTDSGNAGNYHITFTVTDDGSPPLTDSETVSITVGDVNHPPVMGTIGNRVVAEGDELEFTVTAQDSDNDSLFFDAGDLPAGAAFDPVTRIFSWAPAYEDRGNHNIIFSVSDSGTPPLGDSETVTITVGDVNRPPAICVPSNPSVELGEFLEFAISISDSDNDNLFLSVGDLPTGAFFDPASRTFVWMPVDQETDEGNHEVTFTVTDDGTPPLSVSRDVTIAVGDVNRPPVIADIGKKVVQAGQLLVFAVTATDLDNDELEFSAEGLSSGAVFDDFRQLFYWMPTSQDIGLNILRFTVTDNGTPPKSDELLVDIEVTEAAVDAEAATGDEVAADDDDEVAADAETAADAEAAADAEEETEEEANTNESEDMIIKGGSVGGCFISSSFN
jgi:hypothetical protein